MIFGTPITWFFTEVFASVLFIICIIHALQQENGKIKLIELLAFILYSAIFENIGVFMDIYDYNVNRIMMIGKVPIEILMLEGVIFYVALRLAEKLHIPKWGIPFVVGFLASMQDMTIDPAAVFDLHKLGGVMSGQWNWTLRYDGTFFGIPFFNFSGWMYLMAFFVIALELGALLHKKIKNESFGYYYPFLAVIPALLMLVSISRFVLFFQPFFPMYTRGAEIGMLVFNYLLGLFILLRYQKIDKPFDLKNDGLFFFIPVALHLFDIIIAFSLKIEIAYIPVVVVSLFHISYLLFVYLKGKSLSKSTLQNQVVGV
ncbi:MAG: carotenoid biosynthesis protein [Chloroflexi bacterium]|nr:carotenoid biosynthesis protein [Chloroflexota bacterium]